MTKDNPRDLIDAVWERQTFPPKGTPHAWIQWKGTNVCMDVYCRCGAQMHIDAEFAYFLKCEYCGAVYMTNGHIELVPLTQEEIDAKVHEPSCVVMECTECGQSSDSDPDSCECDQCDCAWGQQCNLPHDDGKDPCECCRRVR